MTTSQRPIYECVVPDDGSWVNAHQDNLITPPKPDRAINGQELAPQGFYEDVTTGQLLYFLWEDRSSLGGFMFQTNHEASTRAMSLDMVAQRLRSVDPTDPTYAFKAREDRALYERFAQTKPKCTDHLGNL